MAIWESNLNATRWLLVSRRDPSANSSFLYGVTSTRIFCRPTCPGRVARRSNVVFFDDLDHASASGYRPCKRCEPCNDGWSRDHEARSLAHRARDMIIAAETNRTRWTVASLARELNITGAHLHRQFKRFYQVTPKSFATSLVINAPVSEPRLTEDEPVTITPRFGIRESEHQLSLPGDLLPMVDADPSLDISDAPFTDDAALLSIWDLVDDWIIDQSGG